MISPSIFAMNSRAFWLRKIMVKSNIKNIMVNLRSSLKISFSIFPSSLVMSVSILPSSLAISALFASSFVSSSLSSSFFWRATASAFFSIASSPMLIASTIFCPLPCRACPQEAEEVLWLLSVPYRLKLI